MSVGSVDVWSLLSVAAKYGKVLAQSFGWRMEFVVRYSSFGTQSREARGTSTHHNLFIICTDHIFAVDFGWSRTLKMV